MNMPLKISKIGNSAGIILPKELLARLRVELGDTLYASETPAGVLLTPSNPDGDARVAMAETIMREDREVLQGLANATDFETQIAVACKVMERRKLALRALAK